MTSEQRALELIDRVEELGGAGARVHDQARVDVVASEATAGRPEGEIVVAGRVLSPGYVNRSLNSAFASGGFHTGDAGYFDDEGLLHVVGRLDAAIITGGENVQPEEVEEVLREHPFVVDAAVLGRPDELWGQVVEALVVAEVEQPELLLAWCRGRLASYKVPRRVRFVKSLPRTEAGKLLRAELLNV
jgi:acyl-CoA synthetase (AMP-forming)/AMP-acid ligase II